MRPRSRTANLQSRRRLTPDFFLNMLNRRPNIITKTRLMRLCFSSMKGALFPFNRSKHYHTIDYWNPPGLRSVHKFIVANATQRELRDYMKLIINGLRSPQLSGTHLKTFVSTFAEFLEESLKKFAPSTKR